MLYSGYESHRHPDETPEQEPPETPAPIFAARALKSAIFGTPAHPEDDTLYEISRDKDTTNGKDSRQLQSGSVSPTKTPGILLTPGTTTTRRKTVSFGTEVVDKGENNLEKAERNNGLPNDSPGEVPSHWAPKLEPSAKPSRKTTLTRSLEKVRERKVAKAGSDWKRDSEPGPMFDLDHDADNEAPAGKSGLGRANKSQMGNQDMLQELITTEEFDGEITMDLNEPHSKSGKYWKSEYEQYHDNARAKMDKLMKYKQLAKSYAKMKDTQAQDLAEKLKEEQRRVLSMEDKICKLSAQIATTGLEGVDDNTPELIKELARQTALALQYKGEVEEFRAALKGNKGGQEDDVEKAFILPKTEQTRLDTHDEPRKAREQTKEMSSLRDKIQSLRHMLSAAEQAKSKLQEENTKLAQDLLHADLRLEQHLGQCEKRRQSMEELRQKKDDAHHRLQKDYDVLKESAKSQRRDAEHLLKQRHEQVVGLKKELAALRGAESTAKDLQQALQKKIVEHDRVVADFERQITQIKESGGRELDGSIHSKDVKYSPKHKREDISGSNPSGTGLPSSEAFHRDSLIPVLSQPLARPSKIVAPSRPARCDRPTGPPAVPSSHSALSEIINNATPETVPPQRSGPVTSTPLANRFSYMSLESPGMELPSPEPSTSHDTGCTVHKRNCQASPRPSMFNIASSPPKPAMVRSRSSDEQKSNRDIAARRPTNVASSQLSSTEGSRVRQALTPQRAAAAKARLAQKNAEKKRAQSLRVEKENIRNEA
jgi:hypothetical protein